LPGVPLLAGGTDARLLERARRVLELGPEGFARLAARCAAELAAREVGQLIYRGVMRAEDREFAFSSPADLREAKGIRIPPGRLGAAAKWPRDPCTLRASIKLVRVLVPVLIPVEVPYGYWLELRCDSPWEAEGDKIFSVFIGRPAEGRRQVLLSPREIRGAAVDIAMTRCRKTSTTPFSDCGVAEGLDFAQAVVEAAVGAGAEAFGAALPAITVVRAAYWEMDRAFPVAQACPEPVAAREVAREARSKALELYGVLEEAASAPDYKKLGDLMWAPLPLEWPLVWRTTLTLGYIVDSADYIDRGSKETYREAALYAARIRAALEVAASLADPE